MTNGAFYPRDVYVARSDGQKTVQIQNVTKWSVEGSTGVLHIYDELGLVASFPKGAWIAIGRMESGSSTLNSLEVANAELERELKAARAYCDACEKAIIAVNRRMPVCPRCSSSNYGLFETDESNGGHSVAVVKCWDCRYPSDTVPADDASSLDVS